MSPLVLAYYGDDFTGSTDVMEALQWSGIRTVLFLSPPSTAQLCEFPGIQAFGIAGTSRAMSVAEMNTVLPPIYRSLRDSGAAVVHYKTCSTFDSSPEIGSIGRALELGREVFGESVVPIVIGAPSLGRYQVFGNLFARSGIDTDPFRLDRHPTMSRHPITPMTEADLREVLRAQMRLDCDLVDLPKLEASNVSDLVERISACVAGAILLDVVSDAHLRKIGQVLWSLNQQERCRFVVGSSGVEYALTSAWPELREATPLPTFSKADRLLVITGSCSPVNDRQISWAEQHGFATLAIDTPRLADPSTSAQEIARVVDLAKQRIDQGRHLVIHSSRGPNDPRVEETRIALRKLGLSDMEVKLTSSRLLGPQFGEILWQVLCERAFSRIAVAGGDTSGFIARQLGLTALEAIAPVAPGSPLCRVHAKNHLDGTEFFFKGGQVGKDNVWETMLNGSSL